MAIIQDLKAQVERLEAENSAMRRSTGGKTGISFYAADKMRDREGLSAVVVNIHPGRFPSTETCDSWERLIGSSAARNESEGTKALRKAIKACRAGTLGDKQDPLHLDI
jgi:hypothetical protein